MNAWHVFLLLLYYYYYILFGHQIRVEVTVSAANVCDPFLQCALSFAVGCITHRRNKRNFVCWWWLPGMFFFFFFFIIFLSATKFALKLLCQPLTLLSASGCILSLQKLTNFSVYFAEHDVLECLIFFFCSACFSPDSFPVGGRPERHMDYSFRRIFSTGFLFFSFFFFQFFKINCQLLFAGAGFFRHLNLIFRLFFFWATAAFRFTALFRARLYMCGCVCLSFWILLGSL